MSTAQDVIAEARKWIGTAEKPINDVLFNTEYYGREVNGSDYAWCVVFLWYVFKHAGAGALFYGGEKTAYAPTLMDWFDKIGRFSSMPEVGAIAFYNFSGGKKATHVGIVTGIDADGITAIEGNTSSTNQTNGGMVEERFRRPKNILGYGIPAYGTEKFEPYAAIVNIRDTPDNYLSVRTGPGTTFKKYQVGGDAFKLPRGMMVAIVEEKNGWGRLSDISGWVSLSYLRR